MLLCEQIIDVLSQFRLLYLHALDSKMLLLSKGTQLSMRKAPKVRMDGLVWGPRARHPSRHSSSDSGLDACKRAHSCPDAHEGQLWV